jgi:hypothetical protein
MPIGNKLSLVKMLVKLCLQLTCLRRDISTLHPFRSIPKFNAFKTFQNSSFKHIKDLELKEFSSDFQKLENIAK